MSSNDSRRLEAWLLVAGMLAASAWYARPQLSFSLAALVELFRALAAGPGG